MQTASKIRHAGGVPSIAGKFAKVLPYARINSKDLGLFLNGYDFECEQIKDAGPDFALIVDALPRIIGMLHSLTDSKVCCFSYGPPLKDSSKDATPGQLKVRLPGVLYEVKMERDGNPIFTPDVIAYRDHFATVCVMTSTKGDVYLPEYLERLMQLARLRYHNFPHSRWNELVEAFCQCQMELAEIMVMNYLVDRGSSFSPRSFFVEFDALMIEIDLAIQSCYRSLALLDVSVLDSWIQDAEKLEAPSTPEVEPEQHPSSKEVLKVVKSPRKSKSSKKTVASDPSVPGDNGEHALASN